MKPNTETAVRRIPQQERSRQKVTAILETAMTLFQQFGMDSISMREIAREAGMPIATVYQYFPNKQSIVQTIWENHTSDVEQLLETELGTLLKDSSSQSLKRTMSRIIDSIADVYDRNPAYTEIRQCVAATPDLRRLNLDNTLRISKLLKQVIVSVNPGASQSEVANYALIATEAASSTVKLGQQLPADRRNELYESLKSFLVEFFQSLSK